MRRWRRCRRCSRPCTRIVGGPSIPPEWLLKASLLMSLYSVRSERAFCEELEYHLLFRWFLDMDMVEASFDHSTFSKNRERLLLHRVSREFFDEVVRQASRLDLLSDDHFSVDGTLIEAAASRPSGRRQSEQSVGGLPWRETLQRHASEQDRPRCPPLPQRPWQGGKAQLHGSSVDGESAWSVEHGRGVP